MSRVRNSRSRELHLQITKDIAYKDLVFKSQWDQGVFFLPLTRHDTSHRHTPVTIMHSPPQYVTLLLVVSSEATWLCNETSKNIIKNKPILFLSYLFQVICCKNRKMFNITTPYSHKTRNESAFLFTLCMHLVQLSLSLGTDSEILKKHHWLKIHRVV